MHLKCEEQNSVIILTIKATYTCNYPKYYEKG